MCQIYIYIKIYVIDKVYYHHREGNTSYLCFIQTHTAAKMFGPEEEHVKNKEETENIIYVSE